MIRRLRVENYKSLKALDLRLQPLNLLVGPNNAGKSNVIDALMLLPQWLNQGGGAIHSRGGFADIVWNGDTRRTISIEIEGALGLNPREIAAYQVSFAGGPQHFAVTGERFSMDIDGKRQSLLEFVASAQRAILFDVQGQQMGVTGGDFTSLSLRGVGAPGEAPIMGQFAKRLGRWTSYRFDLEKMKRPPPAKRETALSASGDNVSSVLHTLQTEFPDRFSNVKDLLASIVPEFRDMYTPLTEQGQAMVRTREEGLEFETPLWALSDGILHALALAAALHAPDPPGLMCFDEPESLIHPRSLSVIAEAFEEASRTSQIIISTHSPYFVDCFKPKHLLVVEKSAGATVVKQASKRKGIKDALTALGLGELWYSGALGGVPRSD